MRLSTLLLSAALGAALSLLQTGGLRVREFLSLVHDELAQLLPAHLSEHQWRVRFSLLQVYFEHPGVHYEIWVQRKNGRVELGLHFEGEREDNLRWAAVLSGRAPEVQSRLGPVELEEWTRSWTRLHETRSLEGELTPDLGRELAGRLAEYIEVLEPIMAEERVASGP